MASLPPSPSSLGDFLPPSPYRRGPTPPLPLSADDGEWYFSVWIDDEESDHELTDIDDDDDGEVNKLHFLVDGELLEDDEDADWDWDDDLESDDDDDEGGSRDSDDDDPNTGSFLFPQNSNDDSDDEGPRKCLCYY